MTNPQMTNALDEIADRIGPIVLWSEKKGSPELSIHQNGEILQWTINQLSGSALDGSNVKLSYERIRAPIDEQILSALIEYDYGQISSLLILTKTHLQVLEIERHCLEGEKTIALPDEAVPEKIIWANGSDGYIRDSNPATAVILFSNEPPMVVRRMKLPNNYQWEKL